MSELRKSSYLDLPQIFYSLADPTLVASPELKIWNSELAEKLQIAKHFTDDDKILAEYFSGNRQHPKLQPLALAYAGHQFGHFVPQLGDGRAHMLGEISIKSKSFDIQLKGSGPTPFSRGGDGRCALGSAIREYLMSEALHFLGVPTTRTLCVVATGESVLRGSKLDGAVLTRVAGSHLRVGSFEFAAINGNIETLKKLAEYAIKRHYPETPSDPQTRYLEFFKQVMHRQIYLINQWLRIGFIHGVINTDNTSISGETIDYGPCAMMNRYDPNTVFSSIDKQGRYAFGNQADVCVWNLASLAQALLPLFARKTHEAVELATNVLDDYWPSFLRIQQHMYCAKIGFSSVNDNYIKLYEQLLKIMHTEKLDYTNTFLDLSHFLQNPDKIISLDSQAFKDWLHSWSKAIKGEDLEAALKTMNKVNPQIIPRNHVIEKIIARCYEGDYEEALQFLQRFKSPYEVSELDLIYCQAPLDDTGYKTFCGT